MTNGRSLIKQAFIAALCEHPDAEKYRARAFSGDNLEQLSRELVSAGQQLTKADFLTPFDDGKYVLDSASGWKNFNKIEKILRENGEKFEVADFLKKIGTGDRTLLKSAEMYGGLDKVFSAEVWQNRVNEMEDLWFFVSGPERRIFREGNGLLPVKREIMAATGQVPREDVLIKAGITPNQMSLLMIEDGRFDEYQKKLADIGDKLCKADLFVVDGEGDTLFYSKITWNKYDKIVSMLEKNGERLEVDDFLFKRGTRLNIMERAAEAQALDKLFKPEYWVGRVDDMVRLWSHSKPAWPIQLQGRDFGECIAEVEDLTWGRNIRVDGLLTKSQLLEKQSAADGSEMPVIALGLKSLWSKIDQVCEVLDKKGHGLTLSDLRTVCGHQQVPAMLAAAQAGRFDKVIGIAEASGEKLTAEDFLAKGKGGKTLIQTLAEKKQLKLAFSEKIWTGRIKEMQWLWQHVPPSMRGDIDFTEAQSKVRIASVGLFVDQAKRPRRGGASGPK